MPDWLKLRDENAPILWAIAFRILVQHDDARDCVQEVLLEAIETSRRTVIRNWPAYLRWLTTRRSIDALRRRRPHQELFDSSLAVSMPCELELKEAKELVRNELSLLPIEQSTAFWMFHVEEMSGKEIAQLMNTTPNAIRILVHRTKKHLQSKLAHLNV